MDVLSISSPTFIPTLTSKLSHSSRPKPTSYFPTSSPKTHFRLQVPGPRLLAESSVLLILAVNLEKGTKDVQLQSAEALMEITAVAEEDAELRTSALYRNSPARKSIVDQLVIKITDEKEDPELLIPCIKAVGNLATTFEATDTRMIVDPLLRLLHETNNFITKNACIALTKFACTSNYFHVEVSKAIIIAGAATQLIRLFYFGHWNVQLHALVLICYIAIHVPGSEELAQAKVLAALKWAPKHHYFTDHEKLNKLFYAALDVPENEVLRLKLACTPHMDGSCNDLI